MSEVAHGGCAWLGKASTTSAHVIAVISLLGIIVIDELTLSPRVGDASRDALRRSQQALGEQRVPTDPSTAEAAADRRQLGRS